MVRARDEVEEGTPVSNFMRPFTLLLTDNNSTLHGPTCQTMAHVPIVIAILQSPISRR